MKLEISSDIKEQMNYALIIFCLFYNKNYKSAELSKTMFEYSILVYIENEIFEFHIHPNNKFFVYRIQGKILQLIFVHSHDIFKFLLWKEIEIPIKNRYILLDIEQIIIVDNPGFTELQKNKIQKEYQD